MSERVRGLAASNALFDGLTPAARHELADTLGPLARDISAAQQALVAKATGHLAAGLTIQLLIEQLRARVGLFGLRGGKSSKAKIGDRYYGRFVNFGRKAQTVVVQRRRRVNGRLRAARGRKVAGDIVATYALKVKARPAREFIQVPDARAIAAQRLANFWGRVIPAAGASA